MRKVILLILIVAITCSCVLFSACDSDKKYDINAVVKELNALINYKNNPEFFDIDGNVKFTFDAKIQSRIDNEASSFYALKNYFLPIFENSMFLLTNYKKSLNNFTDIKNDASTKLYKNIISFKKSLTNYNSAYKTMLNNLPSNFAEETIKTPELDTIKLNKLINTYSKFKTMIDKSMTLTSSLISFFESDILPTSLYLDVKDNELDSTQIIFMSIFKTYDLVKVQYELVINNSFEYEKLLIKKLNYNEYNIDLMKLNDQIKLLNLKIQGYSLSSSITEQQNLAYNDLVKRNAEFETYYNNFIKACNEFPFKTFLTTKKSDAQFFDSISSDDKRALDYIINYINVLLPNKTESISRLLK